MKRGPTGWALPGTLVAFPAGKRMLDGFWRHGAVRNPRLLILVHGMGGDFFHSVLKKTLMARCGEARCDLLSFNNRGSGEGVRSERFPDGLADLDAAIAFGRRQGYRRFVLAGHSTGCQKIAWYQARRRNRQVEALIHLAPGDDYAILVRDLGAAAVERLAEACRRRIRDRHGDEPVPGVKLPDFCEGFTARRLLSIADPRQAEAGLFRYAGPMRVFAGLTLPMQVLFGDREEYACIPVPEMGSTLDAVTASRRFDFAVIPGGDHSFHGCEEAAADAVIRFINGLRRDQGRGA